MADLFSEQTLGGGMMALGAGGLLATLFNVASFDPLISAGLIVAGYYGHERGDPEHIFSPSPPKMTKEQKAQANALKQLQQSPEAA